MGNGLWLEALRDGKSNRPASGLHLETVNTQHRGLPSFSGCSERGWLDECAEQSLCRKGQEQRCPEGKSFNLCPTCFLQTWVGDHPLPAPAYFLQHVVSVLGAINCLHSLGLSSALRTSFPSRKSSSLSTAQVLSSWMRSLVYSIVFRNSAESGSCLKS